MLSPIIVSGAIANKLLSGGEAWVRISWVKAIKRTGRKVLFVEQIDPANCLDASGKPSSVEASIQLQFLQQVIRDAGLEGQAVLLEAAAGDVEPRSVHGMNWTDVCQTAREAALLVNISGHLQLPSLTSLIKRKAYIDIDPGFTQYWHADPASQFKLSGHDTYFTIGQGIGQPHCCIPTGGIDWRGVVQPVVLDDWPVIPPPTDLRFTTVASWRGAFGPIYVGGKTFGVKVHEFRKFWSLPRLVADRLGASHRLPTFEIALDIHPADGRDLSALIDNGWTIVDPKPAAGSLNGFRQYIQASSAEFSVAQGIYVDTVSGWFSDRTVRYLAAGRPALVQETGFSRYLPTGEGLIPFSTMDEAIDGVVSIATDYPRHAAAARRLAESHFDADRVIPQFLRDAGVTD